MRGGRGNDCKWGGAGRRRELGVCTEEKEEVGTGEASDSFTAGRGPINDSLFLHDFTSWQSTGLLVALLQLYHYLLALSLLRICESELVNVEGSGPWGLGRGQGRKNEADLSRSIDGWIGRSLHTNVTGSCGGQGTGPSPCWRLCLKRKGNRSCVEGPWILYVIYYKYAWDAAFYCELRSCPDKN